MLARKLQPPEPRRVTAPEGGAGKAGARAVGAGARPVPVDVAPRTPRDLTRSRRRHGRIPSRGPHGSVDWWSRPAPSSDQALWHAVIRIHEHVRRCGLTVTGIARRLTGAGRPLRRETVSRVLNGKQPTTWATVEVLAEVFGVEVDDLRPDDLRHGR